MKTIHTWSNKVIALLLTAATVFGLLSPFAITAFAAEPYIWDSDATGVSLTGVTTVNVHNGASGILRLTEDEVTINASGAVPVYAEGSIEVDNPSANIVITAATGTTFTVGEISGEMESLIINGNVKVLEIIDTAHYAQTYEYITLSEGGISADIGKLTVMGELMVQTGILNPGQASKPQKPGIATAKEIVVYGKLTAASGNLQNHTEFNAPGIVLPDGGSIVVENGGVFRAEGSWNSYHPPFEPGPGIQTEGDAYIRVGSLSDMPNAACFTASPGVGDNNSITAGIHAGGNVVIDIYHGKVDIGYPYPNAASSSAVSVPDDGRFTVNFMSLGTEAISREPLYGLSAELNTYSGAAANPDIHVTRAVPGEFTISDLGAIDGNPNTATFNIIGTNSVKLNPHSTNPFYLYFGTNQTTPVSDVTFEIISDSGTLGNVVTSALGIAQLPVSTDGTYTVSGPGTEFDFTVSDGRIDAAGLPDGVTAIDSGFGLSISNADITQIAFTATEFGGVAGFADTTGILLTFDNDVQSIPSVTLSGATASTPIMQNNNPQTWLVPISGIQGGSVNIRLNNWDSYVVTTPAQEVDVLRRREITYTAVQVDGISGLSDTSGILVTFSEGISSLTANQVSVTPDYGDPAVTVGTVTDNGDTDAATWFIPLSYQSYSSSFHITLRLDDNAEYAVDKTAKPLTIYSSITSVRTFTAESQSGGNILLIFDHGVDGLTADKIKVTRVADNADIAIKSISSVLTASGLDYRYEMVMDSDSYRYGDEVTISINPWSGENNHYTAPDPQTITILKDIKVSFTVEQLGGLSDGSRRTKSLILTFSEPVELSLFAENVTLSGAARQRVVNAYALEGQEANGTQWLIPIDTVYSNTVTVTVKNWRHFVVDNGDASQTASCPAYYVNDLYWTAEQIGGESGYSDTTHVLITFDGGAVQLDKSDIAIRIKRNGVETDVAGIPVPAEGENVENGQARRWMIPLSLTDSDNDKNVTVSVGKVLPGNSFGKLTNDDRPVFYPVKTVSVYRDFRTHYTLTLEQIGGQDGKSNTTALRLNFTDAEGSDNTGHHASSTVLRRANVMVKGMPIQDKQFKDSSEGASIILPIPSDFNYNDGHEVTVTIYPWELPERNMLYTLDDSYTQTIKLYKDTRRPVGITSVETIGGVQNLEQSEGIRIQFDYPVQGLQKSHIKFARHEERFAEPKLAQNDLGYTWIIPLIDLPEDIKSWLEYIEIGDVPGYEMPPSWEQFYELQIFGSADERTKIQYSVEQVGGKSNDADTDHFLVTFDSELISTNPNLFTNLMYEMNFYFYPSDTGSSYVPMYKQNITENTVELRPYFYGGNYALYRELENGSEGTLKIGFSENIIQNNKKYNIVNPGEEREHLVTVYKRTKSGSGRRELAAVSPAAMHFANETKTLTLLGFFGSSGAEDILEVRITNTRTGERTNLVRGVDFDLPPDYEGSALDFIHRLDIDVSHLAMLQQQDMYEVIYKGADSFESNPQYFHIVNNPAFSNNDYGVLAVTQREDNTFALETFDSEVQMQAQKTAGTTLITIRGSMEREYDGTWVIRSGATINNVLEFSGIQSDTVLRVSGNLHGYSIETIKKTDEGAWVATEDGSVYWNGIRIGSNFEIPLSNSVKYRGSRSDEDGEDVLLTHSRHISAANMNMGILKVETNQIKLYENQFSLFGGVAIGGQLPGFLGAGVDVELHDMLLSDKSGFQIPPMYAEGQAYAYLNELFGAGGRAELNVMLNTLPETYPHVLSMEGSFSLANFLYVDGEFVFMWGNIGNSMVFVPDTISGFLRYDGEGGVPLAPPVVLAYFTGAGLRMEGLGDTVFSRRWTVPPIKFTVSGAFKDVTGSILSADKISLTAGPSELSLSADSLKVLEVIDFKDVYMGLGFQDGAIVNGRRFVDAYFRAGAGMEFNAYDILVINGYASFYAALKGYEMAQFINNPNAQKLFNIIDLEATAGINVTLDFGFGRVEARGDALINKEMFSGRAGAKVDPFGSVWCGIDVYFSSRKVDISGGKGDYKNRLMLQQSEPEYRITNLQEIGSYAPPAFALFARRGATTTTVSGMESGYIVAMRANEKYDSIDVYRDDVFIETLSGDSLIWYETGDTWSDNGVWSANYMIPESGDYRFEPSAGSLFCEVYNLLPLPSFSGLILGDDQRSISWSIDAAAMELLEDDRDLFIRLLLRDSATNDVISVLGDHIAPLTGEAAFTLPETLSSGSYYITAVLAELTEEISEETDERITKSHDISHTDNFEFINSEAPGQVTGVATENLGNGMFRVYWDEVPGAVGYELTFLDEHGAVVNSIVPMVFSAEETSAEIQGGLIDYPIKDVDENGNPVLDESGSPISKTTTSGLAYDVNYTASVRAYIEKPYLIPEGDNETFMLPIYGATGTAPLTIPVPNIPIIHVEPQNAFAVEQDGLTGFVSNSLTQRVIITTDPDVTQVNVYMVDGADKTLLGTIAGGGVVSGNYTFEEAGQYSLIFEAKKGLDSGYTYAELLIRTTGPALSVDKASRSVVNGIIDINGATEPGAVLIANGEAVETDNGRFRLTFPAEHYLTTMHLEAVDFTGNTSELIFDLISDTFSDSADTYTVIVNSGYAQTTGTGRYAANETVTINAGTRSGYSFTGWTVGSGGVTLSDASSPTATFTMPASDVSITANWRSNGGRGGGGGTTQYTVRFDTDGGSTVGGQSIVRNGKVIKPSDPIKEGFTFAGWYVDKDLITEYDFNTMVTGSITIYAKWTESTGLPPTEWQNPYNDVRESDWFYADIEYAVENGLFAGTDENTFSPNTAMTRAMLVTVLWRQAGSPKAADMPFVDVAQSAYYYDAVAWAVENGIVNGISETMFAPDAQITREQMAAILYRYNGSPELTAGQLEFADSEKVSDWAFDALVWATTENIITGKPDNTLDPQGGVTRAEVAAMLHRFLEK